jgi:hypothetical protein
MVLPVTINQVNIVSHFQLHYLLLSASSNCESYNQCGFIPANTPAERIQLLTQICEKLNNCDTAKCNGTRCCSCN